LTNFVRVATLIQESTPARRVRFREERFISAGIHRYARSSAGLLNHSKSARDAVADARVTSHHGHEFQVDTGGTKRHANGQPIINVGCRNPDPGVTVQN
jgi:hypothetical protein